MAKQNKIKKLISLKDKLEKAKNLVKKLIK